MKKKYIASARCIQVEKGEGYVVTPWGTKVYLRSQSGVDRLTDKRSRALIFDTRSEAAEAMMNSSGNPWHYIFREDSIEVEDITNEYDMYSRDELITRIEELEALYGA